MAFWPLILINIRSPVTDRTYLISAALEASLLGLWIPPTYAISNIVASSATVRKATVATLAFCGINLYVAPPLYLVLTSHLPPSPSLLTLDPCSSYPWH